MTTQQTQTRPGAPETRPPRERRSHWRRWSRSRPFRLLSLVILVVLAWLTWSVGSALTAPGGDSVAARLAEWARDHGMGVVVGWLERVQYDVAPPAVGGTASIPTVDPQPSTASASPQPSAASVPSQTAPAPTRAPGHGPSKTAAPAPLTAVTPPPLSSPAGPNLPGEGQWQVLGSVRGVPAMYGAFVRPDAAHTSYVAGVVSMDPRLVRFQLHPGEADPGPGPWGVPTFVPPADRAGLLATFNGGFKIKDSRGGFFLNGATAGTLTPSAASVVFYRDGRVAIGAWGRDVGMSPDVVGVRQNLQLIVDHGAVPASVDSNVETTWGATIGGAYFVWRSGFGVTADGRLVFVYGPALSVRTLADLLQRAGVVEGMQMEINPAWMSFMYYRPTGDPANPTPVKLLDGQERPADRYFTPTSRDFIQVSAR